MVSGTFTIPNIIPLDQRIQFGVWEILEQVSAQPAKENSAVVHAVSVPSVCRLCPLRGNKPHCNQCTSSL